MHLISLTLSSTWITYQPSRSTEQNYRLKSSLSKMCKRNQSHIVTQMNTLCSRIKTNINSWSLIFKHTFDTCVFDQLLVANIVKQIPTLKCFKWLHFYNNNINLKLKCLETFSRIDNRSNL